MERLPDLTRDETSWRREWQRYLPADYRRRTAVPIRFEREADLQAGGVRVMGFDRWGENCFYHHVYEVPAPIVDDEEGAFQEARCYGQSVFACASPATGWCAPGSTAPPAPAARSGATTPWPPPCPAEFFYKEPSCLSSASPCPPVWSGFQLRAKHRRRKCIGCGRCFKTCGRDVLSLMAMDDEGELIAIDDGDDDEYEKKVMTVAHPENCVGCEACARNCSKKCISHAPAKPELVPPRAAAMDAAHYLALMDLGRLAPPAPGAGRRVRGPAGPPARPWQRTGEPAPGRRRGQGLPRRQPPVAGPGPAPPAGPVGPAAGTLSPALRAQHGQYALEKVLLPATVRAGEIRACRAPSCGVCAHLAECFGNEDGPA